MLDQLRQIAIFAKTIECGSFVKAASALELSPSVVSHHIANLEKQLGVALIYRSTRKLSLTSEGERLLESAQNMASSAEQFINLALNDDSQLIGQLNVTLPAFMAKSALVTHIGDFIKLNPNVSIKLDFTDTRRKIIQDGIDLAIRLGTLDDSNLKTRKLFEIERCIAVSTETSKRFSKKPEIPKDLEGEQWIEFSPVGLRYTFENKSGKTAAINPHAQISVNSIYASLHLVKNSNGIGVFPKFLVDEEKDNNTLIPLLKNWQLDPINVYAVWPSNTPKHGLSKKLISFLLSQNLDLW